MVSLGCAVGKRGGRDGGWKERERERERERGRVCVCVRVCSPHLDGIEISLRPDPLRSQSFETLRLVSSHLLDFFSHQGGLWKKDLGLKQAFPRQSMNVDRYESLATELPVRHN